MLDKRGQSGVLTTILIVMLCIVAVVVVWNIVNPIVRNSSSDINTESKVLGVFLNIKEFSKFPPNSAYITIERKGSDTQIDGIRLLFYDSNGNIIYTYTIKNSQSISGHAIDETIDLMPDLLGYKKYDFTTSNSNLPLILSASKVSAIPYIGAKSGAESSTFPYGTSP